MRRHSGIRLALLAVSLAVAGCSGSNGDSTNVTTGPSPAPSPAPSPSGPTTSSPAACAATVTGIPASVPADPASYQFSVAIGSSCEWRTQSDAPWATLLPSSGRGSATVTLKVEQNTRPDDARTAVVTVNSEAFRVTQSRYICSYTLDPTRLDQSPDGGNVRISLATRDWCPWTATASESWIRVLTPSGTGSASVSVDLDSNPVSVDRRGSLTIAGQRLDVLQRRK